MKIDGTNKESKYKKKDLYYQVNMFNELLKDIQKIKSKISDQYIGRKLSDKELLQIEELKVPLSRLHLFGELVKNQEIFSGKVKSFLFKKNISDLTNYIVEFYITKNMLSFKKLLETLRLNPHLFEIIDFIFPYKNFSNTIINNVTYLMELFTRLYLSKINFKVIIDRNQFLFQSSNNQFKMICIFYISPKFLLDINTTIQRQFNKNSQPTILHKIKPESIKDPKKDYILNHFYTYLSILNIIQNKKEDSISKQETERIFSQYINKLNSKPSLPKNLEPFNISRFLDSEDKSSLFGKCWGCVLNFNEDFIKYIKTFCNKLERHLMNLAEILNKIIEPKYIEPILNLCESMKDFCSKNSILWQISTNQFKPETSKANLYDESIKKEKNIVDSIFNQEIQFNENIKADFQNCFAEAQKEVDKLILIDVKDEKERKIKEKLQENRIKLNNVVTKDNKIFIVKNQLLSYISQYSDHTNKLTEEVINDITEKVNHFVDLANQKEVHKEENIIDWPDCRVKQPNQNETDNVIKFDLLLWYSKIMKELKYIDQDIKNNLLKSIMKLNENNEIFPIINLLMNINNGEISNIDPINKKIIFGTLNAYFIYKLYKQEKTEFIWEIGDYINSFKKREEINDNYFIYKVDDSIKSLEDRFLLYIPKFKKSDILFLFINVIKNDYVGNRDYKLGPLIEEFGCKVVIQKLYPLIDKVLNDSDKSSSYIMDDISRAIYLLYLNPEGKKEELADHESIIKALKNIKVICNQEIDKLKNSQRDKLNEIFLQENRIKASEIILTIIELEKLMTDKFPQYKLEFDDLDFFDDKLKEDFINNYPTLFYFFNKNLLTYQQIKDNFINNKLYDNNNEFYHTFYLWIFGLRIYSSINCINLEQLNETFNEYISNEIKKIIKNKTKRKEKFGTKWINVLLDNIDPNYEDNYILSVYKYIKKIIGYSSNVKPEFKEESISLLKKILLNLIKRVFNDSINDFLQKDISDKDSLLEFFKNADYQLKLEIETDVSEKYNEIIESELYVRELKPFYDKFISEFSSYKNDIKAECLKEKQFTENQFIKERERERTNLIDDKTIKMNTLIKEYQEAFKDIKDKLENSKSLKFNDIIRKFNIFVKSETSIEDLLKNTEQIFDDLNNLKINEIVENENNSGMSELIKDIDDIKNKLIKIKYYNKYKEIKGKINPKNFNINYTGTGYLDKLEKNIKDYINIFGQYEFLEEEDIKNFMNNKEKVLKNILQNIQDIQTIYNNYKIESNANQSSKESEKYLKESKKIEKEKLEIDEQIEKLNDGIQDKKNKIDSLKEKINEINKDTIYSEEKKNEIETKIKDLKKAKLEKENKENEKEKIKIKLNEEINYLKSEIEDFDEKIKDILNELEEKQPDEKTQKKINSYLEKMENLKTEQDNLENDLKKIEQEELNNEENDDQDFDNSINELENELKDFIENISKIEKINKEIKEVEKNIISENEKIKKLNEKSKCKEKNLLEFIEKSKKAKNKSELELTKMKEIDIDKTIMKGLKINLDNLKNVANNSHQDFKSNQDEVNKFLDKKMNIILKSINDNNYIIAPYKLYERIQKNCKDFFYEEYKDFSNLYSKIYEIYNKIINIFTKESQDILFSNENIDIINISYCYPDGDSKDKICEICDKYNNSIRFQPEKSGNIFLNIYNFEQDNKIITFHHKNHKGRWPHVNIGHQLKIFKILNIDKSKIKESIEKNLEEIRQIDYRKDSPSLQFGTGENLKNENEFLQTIDEYFEKAKYLEKIFSTFEDDKNKKSINGIKKIIGNIEEIINDLFNETIIVKNHCKVEFTNTLYKCLGTQAKIDDFNNKISQLQEFILKLFTLIKSKNLIAKINKLNSIKDDYDFFNKKIRLFLPEDKQSNKSVDFSQLNENSDLLKLPIISIVNNTVTCSYPSLKLNFGPYISSLYKDPIKINFTSLVKSLSMTIKDIDDDYKYLLKCSVNNSNGLAQLEIKIPPMKNEEDNKEIVTIKCRIEFNSPGSGNCLLDCEFNIEIIPFNAIIYCKEYKIAKKSDSEYNLCLTHISSGSIINFYIGNYNIDKEIKYTYQLESLENNTSDKPEIEKDKNNLKFILGKKSEINIKRLICQLIINFSDSMTMKIKIDCFLIPFDFKFEIYDYNSKRFSEQLTIFVKGNYDNYDFINKISYLRPNKIPLYFQVFFPKYSYKGNLTISYTNSKYIKVINSENIPKNFDNNFTFNFDLIIDENNFIYDMYTNKKDLYEKSFRISLKIMDVTKNVDISIKLVDRFILNEIIDSNLLNSFSLEIYNKENKWEIIQKNNLRFNCGTYVSQFGLEHSLNIFYKYKYNDWDNEKLFIHTNLSNKILFMKITSKFIIFGTKISYEICQNINFYNYDNNYNIAIIGYLDDARGFWYPCFYSYDSKLLKFKTKYTNVYKNILIEIKKEYKDIITNNKIKGDYAALAYKLSIIGSEWDSNDKKKLLLDLLEKVYNIIGQNNNEKLIEIYIEINRDNISDNLLNKAYYDSIFTLYQILKERYSFIKSFNSTIVSSYLNKEIINKKSDDLLNKYFYLNKSSILENNYINNSFKMINKCISDAYEMFQNMPKANTNKAIIFKEKGKSLLSDKINTDFSLSKSSLNRGEDLSNINTFKTELIQDFNYPPKWSILSLNDFFMRSIKLARELPLFAISAKLEKNNKSLNETEKLYIKLLNLFENTPEKNESFVGELIITFNEQFTKMTNNLLNSNIMFKEGVLPNKLKTNPNKLSQLNKQYIIIPKEMTIYEPNEKQWESNFIRVNKNIKTNDMGLNQYVKTNLYISKDNIQGVNQKLLEQKEKLRREEEERKRREQQKLLEEQMKKKSVNNIPLILKEEEKKEEEKQEPQKKEFKKEDLISNFKIKFKKNRKSSKDEVINLNQNNSNAINIDDNKDMEVNIDTSVKKENIKIDISNFNFNDELLLRLVIERMKEIEDKIKENKKLPELGIKKDLKGQPDYKNEKPSSQNFNVLNLYQRGMSLAHKITKNLSEKSIPFSHISVNLLLDCSGFINIKNKLKQFVIVCGITNALNLVNISYAITIVGDSQFECTLKHFDEEHSMENLQKVLDCLFIKRFIGKSANAVQYALKYTKTNSTYRTILLFSDGLDEDFLLIDAWKNRLFTNNNFSFGFFFINSETICNKHSQELDYIKLKWDEFKKSVRDSGINIALLYYKSTFEDSNKIYDDIAISVSNLLERTGTEGKIPNEDDSVFNIPNFDLSHEENLDSILSFEKALEESYENRPEIFIKKTDVLKNIANIVTKLNVNPYKNKLSKITKYDIKDEKIKSDIHSYAKKFIENRAKLNKAKIEAIFKPNKPSQKVLSTTGTEFDIPALIMNLINPSPDPMIYLEEKGGMIRNYSVSLILDTSYSCFNPLCFSFSLQTLRLMLSTLTSIDLPCFDFILSRQKEPEILCSNLSSVRAINPKSILWESLISILSHPCSKSDLASAIEAAFDLKRMRSSEYTSYLFILTDGLYQENEYKRILRAVSNCVKSGLNVFGIGIGIYPIRIENLFPKIIYCHNPYNLNKAIANFFGESISGVKDSMIFLDAAELNHEIVLNNKIAEIINNSTNLNFQSLYNKLSEVIVETDAFLLISNQEDDMEDTNNEIKSNPTGEGKELLKKDALKGQKILIVMLWSKTLNPDENESVHKDYLTRVSPESEACLKDALDHLGIIIDIVENYRNAIEKITNKNENGKCPYYAVWIINGPPYEDLPDGSNEAFLLGQFLEVLKLFWEKGGALIFLAEGWKLQYQTNEFLKMLDFDGKKIEFYLVGDDEDKGTREHKGGENLHGDKTGLLKEKQHFSKKIERYSGLQRLRLDHNLFILFEGDTICYTSTDDYKKLLPFHPFSRDSQNGISSLFYLSDEKKRGDIFIDCGFTKLFLKMKKDDTAFRYFQNIASWSARTEIHLMYDGTDARDWRPESIDYNIDINKKWTNFLPKPTGFKKIDLTKLTTLFAFDNSGSISGKPLYFNEIDRLVKKYYKNGDKFYLWGDRYTEKSKPEIDAWIKARKGPEGTYSVNIAKLAMACPSHREHLLIVTDGQVSENDIRNSDQLILQNNIQFKFVSVYIIGNYGNLSVGAPYCRGCPNRSIQVLDANNRKKGPSLSLDEIAAFNQITSINSINQFNNLYDKLYSAIKAKQLGKNGDNDLMNKLNSLKSRIINGLNDQQKADFEKKWNELYEKASKGHHDFTIGTAGIKKNK